MILRRIRKSAAFFFTLFTKNVFLHPNFCKMRKIVLLWFCIALTTSLIAQDTTKTYWKNGKLMSIGVQKKGIEQGHWVYYHNNGIKWTEGDYRDGLKVGVWKVWYDDGKLGQEYHADNGPFKSWFQSGRTESEGQFKDGQRDGEWTFYHPNGQLYKKVMYIADSVHGHVVEYFDNGEKYFEGTYDMGLLEGDACWWQRGGKKEMEGKLVHGLQ